MRSPWNFTLFAENVPADVALRVAGLFAASVETEEDRTLVKTMLMQLAHLGVGREEIEQYPALESLLKGFTSGK